MGIRGSLDLPKLPLNFGEKSYIIEKVGGIDVKELVLERGKFLFIAVVIILVGLLFLVSAFKMKPRSKSTRIIACLLAVITVAIGSYLLLLILFFGVNT